MKKTVFPITLLLMTLTTLFFTPQLSAIPLVNKRSPAVDGNTKDIGVAKVTQRSARPNRDTTVDAAQVRKALQHGARNGAKNSTTTCGNGLLEVGEHCDDGNRIDGDSCSSICRRDCEHATEAIGCGPICGDGRINPGEECDDGPWDAESRTGNNRLADYCRPDCHNPRCGDGIVDTGEECDGQSDCSPSCRNTPLVTCYTCADSECVAIRSEAAICNLFYSEPTCGGDCGRVIITIPPTDFDRTLCSDDDLSDRPGVRVREYPEARHVSRCETSTTVRYLICGSDGTITVSVDSCEEGVPCEEGACIVDPPASIIATCSDTDSGNDPYLRGTISGIHADDSSYSNTDFCFSDGTRVYEYICNADGTSSSRSETCPPTMHCEEGACVDGPVPSASCSDSDGGDNPSLRGTVSGVHADRSPYSLTDFCFFDGIRLYEYYCAPDGNEMHRIATCSAGMRCEDGACVEGSPETPTCTDTDGGDNPSLRGTVSGTHADGSSYSSTDFCFPDGVRVYEYACNADGADTYRVETCPSDMRCEDGACVPGCECGRTPPTATDPGYVTGSDCVVQHDICEEATLIRFSCDITGIPEVSDRMSCARGCRNGLCL